MGLPAKGLSWSYSHPAVVSHVSGLGSLLSPLTCPKLMTPAVPARLFVDKDGHFDTVSTSSTMCACFKGTDRKSLLNPRNVVGGPCRCYTVRQGEQRD